MIYEYTLDGLHCAGCGEKILRDVRELDFVDGAELNLATARMRITSENADSELLHILQKIVNTTGHSVSVKAYNPAAKRLVMGRQTSNGDNQPAQSTAEDTAAIGENERRNEPCSDGDCGDLCECESDKRADSDRHGKDGCSCCDDHHSESGAKFYIQLGASLVLFVAGLLTGGTLSAVLLILSALTAGYDTLINGIKGLLRLDIDEGLLMSVAAVAACCIGEFTEAAMVLILNLIGGKIEAVAAGRSRKSIERLTEIRPDTARLADGTEIDADEVEIGMELLVNPFERIPVDAVVIGGASNVDVSAITGESVPLAASEGTALMSGMLNGEGQLHIKATARAEQSAAARIIRLVEDSAATKGSSERIITRFAKIYTPAVMLLCLLVAVIPPIFVGDFTGWLYKALAILVASCPCALVISVPLAFFAGVGAASKSGVLIKGGKYVEKLALADAAAFDKTGTITDGTLTIDSVYTAGGYSRQQVLDLARIAEFNSTHPIARAAVRASDCEIPDGEYSEMRALGVIFRGEKVIVCGGKRLMHEQGVDISSLPDCQVYVAEDGAAVGGITFADSPRKGAADVLSELKSLGVDKIALLTGDSAAGAARTAQTVGVTEVHAGLLPEDKVTHVEQLKKTAKSVIFVGDGINDAPVLAAADVGFAMGLGSDAAIEAADAILTGDSLASLPTAIKISRRTMGAVRFNIAFPLLVKLAVMVSALFYPIMWLAVAADVVVMIITVINAARLIK